MSDRLISYAAGNAPDFSTVEIARCAAAAGWPACGIWYDPETWTAQTTKELKSIFEGSGMVPLDIEVIYIQPEETESYAEQLIEAGAEIGAQNALIVSSDEDLEATAKRFQALAAFALDHGVKPNFEFLPITAVKTLDQALQVIADAPGAALMPDLLHLVRSGGSVEDLARIPKEALHYAQLCDGPADLPSMAFETLLSDALDGRVLPGEGGLPCRDFMAALPKALPISLEIRGEVLRDSFPELQERAAHTLRQTQLFLDV